MKQAEEILSAKKCGDIFTRGSADAVKAEYRELARYYHPDICTHPEAQRIMTALNDLYAKALDAIEHGTWEQSSVVEFMDAGGKRYVGRFLKESSFELGASYISDNSVTYVFDGRHEKFYENAVKQIKSLRYENKAMEREISRYMPDIAHNFKTADGKFCLILRKTPDTFLLSDVAAYYGGKIPDRHVAWIISRLCNLCCYFDYMDIAHNGLTLETCFISPKFHTIMPLGGWWYAQKSGEKMIGVSRAVYDVMPIKAKGEKISTIGTDLEAMRLIGRQLSDPSSTPKEILSFLNAGSSQKATAEFSKWNAVLDAAYGKRQFVKMEIGKLDIYK